MNTHKRLHCISLLLAGVAAGALLPKSAQAAPKLRWEREPSSLALLADGKTVWRFLHGKDVPKPMFHPVALIDGTVLTWDSPPDHPWHHGLWFSWKYLNRVNYWEGDPREPVKAGAPGKPHAGGLTDCLDVRITPRSDFSAAIVMDLAYHPQEGPTVLGERRTIEISAPGLDGAYHMDWTLEFTAAGEDVLFDRTPLAGEKNGYAHGGYAGLTIRFAKEIDGARTVTAKTPAPTVQRTGYWSESGSEGVDLNGMIQGKEAGIALLDHPGNLNSSTPWYLTVHPRPEVPFLLEQAAVIYFHSHRLKAGQSFTLRYRTMVHSGRWDAARLKTARAEYVNRRKQ